MKQKHRKDSQETIGQPWGRVLAPLQGTHIFISVSCFTETPTQVEDLRFLFPVQAEREIPGSSPPTNQKRVTHPVIISPQMLPSFARPGDDHHVRHLIWPLSISTAYKIHLQ